MRLRVNGANMHARGANIIPMEEFEGRQTAAAYRSMLQVRVPAVWSLCLRDICTVVIILFPRQTYKHRSSREYQQCFWPRLHDKCESYRILSTFHWNILFDHILTADTRLHSRPWTRA